MYCRRPRCPLSFTAEGFFPCYNNNVDRSGRHWKKSPIKVAFLHSRELLTGGEMKTSERVDLIAPEGKVGLAPFCTAAICQVLWRYGQGCCAALSLFRKKEELAMPFFPGKIFIFCKDTEENCAHTKRQPETFFF